MWSVLEIDEKEVVGVFDEPENFRSLETRFHRTLSETFTKRDVKLNLSLEMTHGWYTERESLELKLVSLVCVFIKVILYHSE